MQSQGGRKGIVRGRQRGNRSLETQKSSEEGDRNAIAGRQKRHRKRETERQP